jgi:hypothetical protein
MGMSVPLRTKRTYKTTEVLPARLTLGRLLPWLALRPLVSGFLVLYSETFWTTKSNASPWLSPTCE